VRRLLVQGNAMLIRRSTPQTTTIHVAGTGTLINKLLSRNEEHLNCLRNDVSNGLKILLWSTVHSGKIYEHFRMNPTPIFRVADTVKKRKCIHKKRGTFLL
jgi:hypothetical protein